MISCLLLPNTFKIKLPHNTQWWTVSIEIKKFIPAWPLIWMMTLLIHTDWQERFVKVDCDNVALASFLNPNCLFFQFPDRWQEPLLPVFDHLNLARSNTMAFERHSKTTFLILLDPFYRRGRVYKRKFCLCVCLSVCLFVRHHFFLLRIFNDLMV